jgi:hypothetical protein
MRTVGALAIVGGVLGSVVAVIAHFMSRTVASTYYVGVSEPQGGGLATATSSTPLVHPSWWPMLPITVVVGLAVGAGAAWILRVSGFQVARQRAEQQ